MDMNKEQFDFLNTLTVMDLLRLIEDIYYSDVIFVKGHEERQRVHARAIKLGLAKNNAAEIGAILLHRLNYTEST
jgi:hypothetical protein